jgi:hypothetical protein
MTTYTYAQLEGLWINNGGSPATAPIAAAIAMAESSGNSAATSPNPDGGTNVGLWQLDTPGGVGGGYTAAQLADPNTNAKVAVKGSGNGANWSQWATFASGAYKAFMNNGTTPDTNIPGGSASTTAASSGAASLATYNSADCLIGVPNLNPIPSWVPIAGTSTGFCILSKAEARGVVGAVLMAGAAGIGLVGFLILAAGAFQKTPTGRIVEDSVAALGPIGAVARRGARKGAAASTAAPAAPRARPLRKATYGKAGAPKTAKKIPEPDSGRYEGTLPS